MAVMLTHTPPCGFLRAVLGTSRAAVRTHTSPYGFCRAVQGATRAARLSHTNLGFLRAVLSPCWFLRVVLGASREARFHFLLPVWYPGQENLEKTEVFWCNTSVSLPDPGEWVALQVTAVHTSVHFWAQLPFGPKPLDQAQREWTALNQVPEERKDDGETLSALQDSINAIYQQSYTRREDLSLLALGEIVCAQFSRDDSWYRARVVDVDAEANTVQVFYVDYGNCEWLIRSKVRPAMPQFLHLPFQAVECFLGGIELLKPTSPKNQDLDRKLFEELTMDKVLVGRVITSDADILHVELYDTISSKHVNIGDALVKAGFAKHTRTTEQTKEDMSGQ